MSFEYCVHFGCLAWKSRVIVDEGKFNNIFPKCIFKDRSPYNNRKSYGGN
jgi:hypothetical protein